MHLWRLWIALGPFIASAAGAAVIYKWTDADGVVHYSDQAVPGAEKVVTSPVSGNGIGGTTHAAASTVPRAAPKRLDFKVIAIESPANEQVFFGDEVVPVRLALDPALKPEQRITWVLNGNPLVDQAPDALAFALPTLARGTYALSATVTDTQSGESRSATGVTFYVRQPSALAPLNPLRRK